MALSFLRNGRIFTRSPETACFAVRIMFSTEMPGISSGVWNERKSPLRARSNVLSCVMSSPSNAMLPAVTSYFGWPMMTFMSVDLPEPFGPRMTCTSPLPTVSESPLRISLPSTPAWRPLISKRFSFMLKLSFYLCTPDAHQLPDARPRESL